MVRCVCGSCDSCRHRAWYVKNRRLVLERRRFRALCERERRREVDFLVDGFVRGEIGLSDFRVELDV